MSQAASEMRQILAEMSSALCSVRERSGSFFVSTSVAYPNSVGVAVRIDPGPGGFVVSDDAYASAIAETMNAASVFNRIAPGVASRSGITFERGAFVLSEVGREALPVAVGLVANSSSRAIERVLASIEKPRIKRSRNLFDERLRAAFGDSVIFDLEYAGATGRKWEFDAGVERDGTIVRLFELVSPTTQAVAMANMKIADTLALRQPPSVTAALADYEGTDPTLRSILSAAGGMVIAANDGVSKYRLSAA